jgi:hypothetical protein
MTPDPPKQPESGDKPQEGQRDNLLGKITRYPGVAWEKLNESFKNQYDGEITLTKVFTTNPLRAINALGDFMSAMRELDVSKRRVTTETEGELDDVIDDNGPIVTIPTEVQVPIAKPVGAMVAAASAAVASTEEDKPEDEKENDTPEKLAINTVNKVVGNAINQCDGRRELLPIHRKLREGLPLGDKPSIRIAQKILSALFYGLLELKNIFPDEESLLAFFDEVEKLSETNRYLRNFREGLVNTGSILNYNLIDKIRILKLNLGLGAITGDSLGFAMRQLLPNTPKENYPRIRGILERKETDPPLTNKEVTQLVFDIDKEDMINLAKRLT